MKLQQLVGISEKVWVSAFSANLEERGAAKKLQLFKLLVDGRSEDTIAKTLYGNIAAERRKKTLNQSLSELYAEYLRFLLIHFRNYPELLLFHLKGALIEADEERFYLLADVIERTFIDTSNHEALVSLYYILRDHYFYKVTKPVLYKEHCAKLDSAVDNLREFHALESYFVNNDLSRKSMKTSGTEADFQLHREYFEGYFLKEKPLRTQLLARLFWLRCYYSFNYDTLTSARPREVASELWQLLKKRPYVYVNYPEFLQFSNLSYRIYTDHTRLDIKEFNSLFEDYHKLFDDPWILALYPRMYQALLSTQMKYLTEKAGQRFEDDNREIEPQIKKGLENILALLMRIRTKASFADQENKRYGLVTEALCLQYLGGANLNRAIELYEIMLVQEQQNQNAFGKHIIYINLIYCYYLNKDWASALDVLEKYARFTKVNNPFNESIERVIQFIGEMSKYMLNESKLSADELKVWSSEHFKGFEQERMTWAVYSFTHLKV